MKRKVIEIFCMGLFSSLLTIILQLLFPKYNHLSSISGATLGALLGFGIAILVFKAQIQIKKYKKPKLDLDGQMEKWLRLLLLTFILSIPVSLGVLMKIDFFSSSTNNDLIDNIASYCIPVIFYGFGIPSIITYFLFKIDFNNPLIKYSLIFGALAIPLTGLINLFLPTIINTNLAILSFLHLWRSVKK